jgi:hypothetical protein
MIIKEKEISADLLPDACVQGIRKHNIWDRIS